MRKFYSAVLLLSLFLLNACVKTDTGGNLDVMGAWVRLPGPSGDRTDLAIGGITNEPANRVYMCEKRGSTAAGFYKGTYSNGVITWDPQYNFPNYSATVEGSQLVIDCNVCVPTYYEVGTWSGECGPLENTSKKIAVGIENSAYQGLTITSVSIENIPCPLTLLNTVVTAPDCSSNSYINTPGTSANPNYYSYRIAYSGIGLGGPYTGVSVGNIVKSDLGYTCNKYKVLLTQVGSNLFSLGRL
jgi:hypothetical protein